MDKRVEKRQCPRCGLKNQGQYTVFPSGSTYTNTDCTGCNYHYGILLRSNSNDALQGEWSRNTNAEKEAHSKDILQPRNKDGTINKHFVEAHGTKILQKEFKASDKAIRENAEKYG